LEKPGQISCRLSALRHLFARPWRNRCQKPSLSAQFQRNENCANIHSDSGWRFGPLNSLEHRPLQSKVVVAASLWQSAGRYPPPWNLSFTWRSAGVDRAFSQNVDDSVEVKIDGPRGVPAVIAKT
jgi:hypothetical protein